LSSPATGRLSLSQAVVTAHPVEQGGDALSSDALRMLRDLANSGDPNAQLALAVRYANGEGVRQSYSEALKWFNRAQAHGAVIPGGSKTEQAWTKVQAWAASHDTKR
jgi:TPR repeat protein